MIAPNVAATFLQEAGDLLARIEETILDVRVGEPPGEAVHQLFRAFHTIKGSGSMFGFDAVAGFTHHVETVLDQVRDGAIPVTREMIDLILASKDHIEALLEEARGGAVASAVGADLVPALHALLQKPEVAAVSVAPASAAVAGAAASETFRIHFRPDPGLMLSGTNPLSLLDELRSLGECAILADTSAIPPLDALQPDHCHFAWDITLTTDRGINAIRDVFIFVEDGSEIRIERVDASVKPAPVAAAAMPVAPEAKRVASVAPGHEPAAPAAVTPTARKAAAKDSSVRVPSERLDRMVNLVGEFVMNQSRLTQLAARVDVPDLSATVEALERLVTEMRDTVLGIRMMPIGATFSRFKRLVHDLSGELGKEIDLVTEGAETEVDKTVLDQLGDPLVHIIRNSIDHGIEGPDARAAQGKARRGTVRLAAAHVGSSVRITISDDGRGLDAVAIRAKAIEKKLVPADAKLTPREIFDLIFQPGFSTAKAVTNLSGRGVGMDVVKRQLDALGGTARVDSVPGQGTTITLTLPLTLAIIEGLLVEVGREQFIVPMAMVTENVELARAERARNNGRNLVAVRGELIPYFRMREAFVVAEEELAVEKIVILRHGDERVGLVVDRVLGSHQTVIQPLGRFFRGIEIVSGSTIMGDGRVALILDVAGLVRFADRERPA